LYKKEGEAVNWVESAMWNGTLAVMEAAVLTLCTWFFLSHMEQSIDGNKKIRFAMLLLYGIGYAGLTFGMNGNPYINLALPAFMIVMTAATGFCMYSHRRLSCFYYFLFPVTVIAAQILIGYLVIGYMSARWGTFVFDYYLANVMLIIRQLTEILLTGVWVVMLNRQKYEDVKGVWFAGLFLPPVVSAFIIFSLICIGNVFMQMYGVFLIITDILLLVSMNLYIWFLFSYQSKNKKLKAELEIQRKLSEMQYQYYERVEQQYLSSRKMIHDMRNHLQSIEALTEQDGMKGKEYIKDMHQMLDSYTLVRYTDNRMLNIILNEKAKEAEEAGIAMDIRIGKIRLLHVRDMDITTIFANLLDNALEAAGQAEGERRIRIRADVFHEFVAMRIQNTIAGSNERSGMTGAGRGNVKSELGAALNKAPDETGLCGKNAEKNHIEKRHMGLGLENVRHALEKYGGGMMTEAAGDEFIVNLTIPDASGVEEETSICE
jgi:two-component system sensor histidine kinase AgrC